MSFGFSISDFITVGEKALKLYNRCSSAASRYADLSAEIQVLHQVFVDIREFYDEEQETIPADRYKVTGLIVARQSCELVIDEVDAFLDKHAGVASSTKPTKRWIEIAKFVTKDVDGLKSRLRHNTALLQLALTSLYGLSISRLSKALETRRIQEQTGLQEPSVISHAIESRQQIDRNANLDQIASDLEDQDIHPDSVVVNRGFIISWLARVIEEEGADTIAQLDQSRSKESVESLPNTLNSAPDLVVEAHDPVAQINNQFPVSETGGSLRGRSDSVASHRSKPDDWRPYDRANPAYVDAMLEPLFKSDPFKPPGPEVSRMRFIRAFNQQDWNGRGYLTRPEAVQICHNLVRSCSVVFGAEALRGIVSAYDKNRNAKIERQEFVELLQYLLNLTSEARQTDVAKQLSKLGADAHQKEVSERITMLSTEGQSPKASEGETRQTASHFTLPWGWSRNPPDATEHYFDQIRKKTTSKMPDLRYIMQYTIFSTMAQKADQFVRIIDDAEKRILQIVPKALHLKYADTLEIVRTALLNFNVFESRVADEELSDLDALLTYNNAQAWLTSTQVGGETLKLLTVYKSALSILLLLQGFCISLSKVVPIVQLFEEQFESAWQAHKLDAFASLVATWSSSWADLNISVSEIRSISHQEDEQATLIQLERWTAMKEQLHQMWRDGRWEMRIVEIKCKQWILSGVGRKWKVIGKERDSPYIALCVKVSDRKSGHTEEVTTSFEPATGNMSFTIERKIVVSRDSEITIELMGKERKSGISSLYKMDAQSMRSYLDCAATYYTGNDDHALEQTLTHQGQCYFTIQMQLTDPPIKARSHYEHSVLTDQNIRRNTNWEEALVEYQTDYGIAQLSSDLFPHALKPSNLPAGWEQKPTPEGRLYYANHVTRTTTWVRPKF